MCSLWAVVCCLLASGCADIHVGRALNVLGHFGDLGAVVRVDPHNKDWFFDHDSVDVFEEVLEIRSPTLPAKDAVFTGDFHLQLCDDTSQLMAAYYRSHVVEGVDRPWRGFSGGWSPSVTARHLGLNASYLTGSHGYVLVRLTRVHELVRLTPHTGLRLNNWTAERMEAVTPGQVGSVLDFIRVSGSHYVNAYGTGDSLYQVFVFTPAVYEEIRLELVPPLSLDQVLSYFTPWQVEHMGRILSSGGNTAVELWAAENLSSRVFVFRYSSLLNLHNDSEGLRALDSLLDNDALLSVELRTITPLFRDDLKRLWFQEVLDNQLKMWDLNV